MKRVGIAGLTLWMVLAGCATLKKPEAPVVAPGGSLVSGQALTRDESILRVKQIASVSYTLWFGLDGSHADFEGRVVASFELRNRPKDLSRGLFMDFDGGVVRSLRFNGNDIPVDSSRYDGKRIHFKPGEIQPGMNRAEIAFSHSYGFSGPGLNRYADPQDDQVYLFSNINPHGARFVFPCFDQPDLRASFELTVETPDDWQVITNTKERDSTKVDGRMSWAFPPSPKLSTSVFALDAGPYVFKSSETEGIPVRLFARKSLEDRLKLPVNAKEWFDVTGKGFEFFNVQFEYPYPYSKYDQVLVPVYDSATISSAGAVAFSERFLLDAKASPERARERVDTILHEQSHMWFGNLVTPPWWHSLWFYQAFADFMSVWAQADPEGLHQETAWLRFLTDHKLNAYKRDHLEGQKPLEIPIAGVEEPKMGSATPGNGAGSPASLASTGSDDTGKAAAILKQLRFYVGLDEFRDGVQRFFIKYALRNAGVPEFLRVLGEAAGQDLTAWHKAWLQTTGMNSLRAEWKCDEREITWKRRTRKISKISEFRLIQSGKVLRPHRTLIALFSASKGSSKLKPTETVDAVYSAATTDVRELVGKDCPEFVFPNYDDQDYTTVELDPASIPWVQKNLHRIPEALTRQLLLAALWDRVLDHTLSMADYSDFAMSYLKNEKEPEIISWTLGTLIGTVEGVPPADPQKLGSFLVKGARAHSASSELGSIWRERLMHAPAQVMSSPDIRKFLQD